MEEGVKELKTHCNHVEWAQTHQMAESSRIQKQLNEIEDEQIGASEDLKLLEIKLSKLEEQFGAGEEDSEDY